MRTYIKAGLVLPILLAFSMPASSEPISNSCDLIDGYYWGMTSEEAKINYREKTRDNLVCEAKDKYSDRGGGFKCDGSMILGAQSNVAFIFSGEDRLIMVSGRFSSDGYITIKQNFFNRFGKPKTFAQCKYREESPSGSCEGAFWNINYTAVLLGEWDSSNKGPASPGGMFSITMDVRGVPKSTTNSSCFLLPKITATKPSHS